MVETESVSETLPFLNRLTRLSARENYTVLSFVATRTTTVTIKRILWSPCNVRDICARFLPNFVLNMTPYKWERITIKCNDFVTAAVSLTLSLENADIYVNRMLLGWAPGPSAKHYQDHKRILQKRETWWEVWLRVWKPLYNICNFTLFLWSNYWAGDVGHCPHFGSNYWVRILSLYLINFALHRRLAYLTCLWTYFPWASEKGYNTGISRQIFKKVPNLAGNRKT
jgi:hypothetical protein